MFGIVVVLAIAAIIGYVAIKQSGKGRLYAKRAGLLAVVVLAILFAISLFRIVPPGHAGVPVLLGKVQGQMQSGLNLVVPIVNVVLMDVRTNAYTMSAIREEGQIRGDDAIDALASNGLTVSLDVTVWYRLDEQKASWVYKNIGPNYVHKIVRPSIRTALRDAATRFTASKLYSADGRTEYTAVADSLMDASFSGKGIIRERVLLRRVKLPAVVSDAIESKLAEDQNAQKMEFTLAKETKEAERKRIEARGIADANRLIAKSLTSSYLTWFYVKALGNVADSENSTFVIMPFDQKLTPLLNVNR